jgi:mono/diheme cytochrome c family protein
MTAAALRPGAMALLGVVLGAAGCNSSNDAGPPIPVDPVALYTQMCARCHGVDGKGDALLKKTMPMKAFSDPEFLARANNEEIERVIMTGRNQMPSFASTMSAPKIQAVTGYVRRLGGR